MSVISQAHQLGAQSIVLIGGGEPTIYSHFRQLIEHVSLLDMTPVVFTNTQTVTSDLAGFLHQHNTSVIIKLDSLDEDTQDDMAGFPGAYRNIRRGLQNLMAAGYENTEGRKLGASFVVNKQNALGIPDVWRFCRERQMAANLEKMVPNERGRDQRDLLLSRGEWRSLVTQLLELDRAYGYVWLPYTPMPGHGCFQCLYNLYITVDGSVRPCSSVQAEGAANVR